MRSGTFSRKGAALLLSALAACGGIQAAPKAPLADLEASLVQLQGAYSTGDVVDCLAQPLASQDAVFCRDRIVQALMIAVDLRYEEFEIGFFDTNRYAGFGATLAALGLSTAGAVVSGGTSQILSAAAAGVIGAREGFKREVLVEQTSVALLTAMRAQRDKVGLNIRLGLRRDATQYPLGAALADVSAYYRAGTIVGALTGVTEAVGVEREHAREELQQSIVNPQFVPQPLRGAGASAPAIAAEVTRIVQGQIIPNPRTRLPPKLPPVPKPEGCVTSTECALPPERIIQYQTALCIVPPTGAFDTATRTAIHNFSVGRTKSENPAATTNKIDDRTKTFLDQVRTLNCATAGLQNAYEVGWQSVRGRIGDLQSNLQELLNKTPPLTKSGTLDQNTRDAIAKFCSKPELDFECTTKIDESIMKLRLNPANPSSPGMTRP
jgi:hypothetical protein